MSPNSNPLATNINSGIATAVCYIYIYIYMYKIYYNAGYLYIYIQPVYTCKITIICYNMLRAKQPPSLSSDNSSLQILTSSFKKNCLRRRRTYISDMLPGVCHTYGCTNRYTMSVYLHTYWENIYIYVLEYIYIHIYTYIYIYIYLVMCHFMIIPAGVGF